MSKPYERWHYDAGYPRPDAQTVALMPGANLGAMPPEPEPTTAPDATAGPEAEIVAAPVEALPVAVTEEPPAATGETPAESTAETPAQPAPAPKGRKTAQQQAEEKRSAKLDAVREQVEDGGLVIRKMTDEEREKYPPRPTPVRRPGRR